MQNEPNLARLGQGRVPDTRKTRNEANSEEVGRGRPTLDQVEGGLYEEVIVRDKANLPSAPGNGRGRPGRGERNAQNEPNFRRRRVGRGPEGQKCAERTQFPAAQGGTRPQGRGTRGKCAKRSQFAARRVARASCPWIRTMGRMGTPNAILCVWEPMPMPPYRLTAALRTWPRPRGQLCKTNPICPAGRGRREQNVQNEPNFE